MRDFKEVFSDEQEVAKYFSPDNWPMILADKDKSFEMPTMTMALVNDYYTSDTAEVVVQNAITGLYSITEARKTLDDKALKLAAGLFVAKYGKMLSMFAMHYFFANYIAEYKSNYSQIDMQDILQKCGVFLRKWQHEYGRRRERREASRQAMPVDPIMSLYSYLYEEYVKKGKKIETSALYQYHLVSDEEVKGIESGRLLCL